MDGVHHLFKVHAGISYASLYAESRISYAVNDFIFCFFLYLISNLVILTVKAQTTQEESQRMTAVRKAYQKAIVTPTQHAEQLWKDYENFENSVSRTLVLLSSFVSIGMKCRQWGDECLIYVSILFLILSCVQIFDSGTSKTCTSAITFITS